MRSETLTSESLSSEILTSETVTSGYETIKPELVSDKELSEETGEEEINGVVTPNDEREFQTVKNLGPDVPRSGTKDEQFEV